MPKYVSLRQFLAANEGLPLFDSNPSPVLLNEYLRRAEADIDNALNFDTRQGGFEPHTVYIQQPFDPNVRKTRIETFPIAPRKVTRYQIQIGIANILGTGAFADIQGTEANINFEQGYIEILPLYALTYSTVPFMMPFGLNPPLAHVEYTTGFYLPVFQEVATNLGDNVTYSLLRGFLADSYSVASMDVPVTYMPAAPPNVYVNGNLKAADGSVYTVDYTEGLITFTTAQATNAVVTCDYTYQIPDDVREATVYQASHLLAQRELNQFGMRALTNMTDSGRGISRQPLSGTLCPEAAARLRKYKTISMG